MSKLDPRPTNMRPLKSWKDLNNTIQNNLSHGNPEKRFLVVDLREYEMSEDEIRDEAVKQGYKVTVEPNKNYLRFE